MATLMTKLSARIPYDQAFVYDLLQLRARAKTGILKNGAAAGSNGSTHAIELLQITLETEIVCMLRYTLNAITAAGVFSTRAKREFLEHARDEHNHMERTAARLQQLGGKPDFNPRNLATREAADDIEAGNLIDMIEENLVAERIACEHYRDLIDFFTNKDRTTALILKSVLDKKEEHAATMHDLILDHERRRQIRNAADTGVKTYMTAGYAT